MRKVWIAMVLAILMLTGSFVFVAAENNEEWFASPIITKAFEQATGEIYIEWEGKAPVYQIHLDGKKVTDVIVNHHVIKMDKGIHNIVIYPINEIREAETKLDFGINVDEVAGGNLSIDLAALGIDPKRLASGNPSETLTLDYKPSQIRNGTPDNLSAITDPENRVVFSFADQYTADEYLVTIKHRNDKNYVTFNVNDDKAKELIHKENTVTSLILDPAFLQEQECLIPELNEEYKFTVQLRKYGTNIITGEKERTIINESKVSGELAYKVTAAWKMPAAITFASQTADGQFTIRWNHEDYGQSCEYAVMKIKKVLGVMTGEELIGRAKDHEYIINDLVNGSYCFNIVPLLNDEKGIYSSDANVDIRNDWVVAPELVCEQIGTDEVRLSLKSVANIEKYHITVSTGDTTSLLRFVDLDYSKYAEFDVEATEGEMKYIYHYDKEVDTENGLKIKFEIYGLRHSESGEEQRSAVSVQSLVMK